MKKVLKFLDDNLEKTFLVVLLAIMTVLIFTQVVLRYAFNSGLAFTEELGRYLFVWLTFIGIAYCVKLNRHMAVDAVYNALPRKGKLVFDVLRTVLDLTFGVLGIIYGWQLFEKIAKQPMNLMVTMDIHMKWVYLATFVGFLLYTFRIIQVIVLRYLEAKKEKQSSADMASEGGASE